jgi:hypothetical protein
MDKRRTFLIKRWLALSLKIDMNLMLVKAVIKGMMAFIVFSVPFQTLLMDRQEDQVAKTIL